MSEQGMIDLQSTLMGDLYRSESKPPTADVKQVIDTLKERVQPLTAEQMRLSATSNISSPGLCTGRKNLMTASSSSCGRKATRSRRRDSSSG